MGSSWSPLEVRASPGATRRVLGSSCWDGSLTVFSPASGPGGSREPAVACAGVEQGDLWHGAGGPGGPGQVGRQAGVPLLGGGAAPVQGTMRARAPTARLRSTRQGHRAVPTPALGAQNVSAPQSSPCPSAAPPAARLRSACAEASVGTGHGTESSGCGPWGRAPSRGRVFRVHPAVARQAFAAPLWPHPVPLCDTGGESRGRERTFRPPTPLAALRELFEYPSRGSRCGAGTKRPAPPSEWDVCLPLSEELPVVFLTGCAISHHPHPPQPGTTPVSLCSANTPFLFCSLLFLWFSLSCIVKDCILF